MPRLATDIGDASPWTGGWGGFAVRDAKFGLSFFFGGGARGLPQPAPPPGGGGGGGPLAVRDAKFGLCILDCL